MEYLKDRMIPPLDEEPEHREGANIVEIPTYRKYTIGIDEAARYYGIGTKKLRQLIADNPCGDFFWRLADTFS